MTSVTGTLAPSTTGKPRTVCVVTRQQASRLPTVIGVPATSPPHPVQARSLVPRTGHTPAGDIPALTVGDCGGSISGLSLAAAVSGFVLALAIVAPL